VVVPEEVMGARKGAKTEAAKKVGMAEGRVEVVVEAQAVMVVVVLDLGRTAAIAVG